MATAADFPVKFMHSGMPRAPVLNGQPGSLITLLDAFLVTGWGAMTPQRVHVEGGVATVQCDVGDTFDQICVIEVSGAEQQELNGQHRVLTSAATSFTFATNAPDGYATGSISIKAAAAGWEKVFSGQNKAVYRSTSVFDAGFCWRVDDTQGQAADVRGFYSMSDIDSGVGQFPTADVAVHNVHKSDITPTNAARHYDIFADSQFIIVSVQSAPPANSANNYSARTYFLGTPINVYAGGDAHNAICGGANNQYGYAFGINYFAGSIAGDLYGPPATVRSSSSSSSNSSTDSGISTPFQGDVKDIGAIRLVPVMLMGNGNVYRADVPGIYFCPQLGLKNYVNVHDIKHITFPDGATHTVLAVPSGAYYMHFLLDYLFFVDVTGPWRKHGGA